MARKKVTLQLIPDKSARRVIFNKKKKGLFNKVQELSTLCGVEAGVFVYDPFHPTMLPEVWPPGPGEAAHVLSKLQDMPETVQQRKMLTHSEYYHEKIRKVNEDIRTTETKIRELQLTHMMIQGIMDEDVSWMGLEEANRLDAYVRLKTEVVQDRIKMLSSTN